MKGKNLLVLTVLAILLFAGNAMAQAWPDVNVLNADLNQYSPAGGITPILFTVSDPDAPDDANVEVYYINTDTWERTEITSELDRNSVSICGFSLLVTDQLCTVNWTMPAELDGNFQFDVNVQDIENIALTGEDHNHVSLSFQIDTNACDSNFSVANSRTVTLDTNCTGFGSTAVISYSSNRAGGCADNFTTYTDPFNKTFGEHTICFRSVDSVGNTEGTQGFTFTADSDAVNLALLTELALAGLLLFAILGSVILFKQDLDAKLMIGLTVMAIIVAIAILIFAVIL